MKRVYLLLLVAGCVLQLNAQITEFPWNEGFEDLQFPPTGWTGYPIVAGDMEFVRATEGEWPECLPHDGSEAMAKYGSFNASAGEQAVLISPEMMLTDDNVLRFWFFRSEDPSNNRHDKIEVYYNTSPGLAGATFLDSVSRAMNFYPVVSQEGWYQYEFAFDHPGSTYIIFKAISAYGWNMYLDDVEVNTSSIDQDPPVVISLGGTQVYAQQPMNLKLVVRDVSDMPETLDGELTINGQTQIVVMTKTNGSQGDFTYEGIIAGQPDHTQGDIRFWLTDEFNNNAWSGYFTLHWDWIQPILEEGFEGEVFPPANWTVTGEPLTWLSWDDYGMVYYTDSDEEEWEVFPPEGERQAAVEWDFQGNAQDEWLISPEVPVTVNSVLTFKTFVRLRSYDYDEFLVKVSSDGFNWETLWSAYDHPAGVSSYEDDIALSLNNYVGEEIRIAWHAYNLYGTNLWYSWFVDDVKIRVTDTITGVNQTHDLPNNRAYPNPFTAGVTIDFHMTGPGPVSLCVFNCTGAKVYDRVMSLSGKGRNEILIDGTDWTSGLYFYQLRTPTGTAFGKIIRE
ncbi:MAG: T9SS type A sorting domain-containing protein [Bacteroidales bacterium]|nr:T9SS type A sorting domain-containing protein [Bacteroidales bacterium]